MEFILSTIPKRRIHMLKKIVLASLTAVVLTAAVPALETDYLYNKKSGKFHYST